MINLVYETLKTVLNKELRGNVTPTEFNLIAKQVQEEIFQEYFVDEAKVKYKENRGYAKTGYSNLSLNQRQKIDQFSAVAVLTYSVPNFILPEDLYFIKDFGIDHNGTVVEELESKYVGFQSKSLAAPSSSFPVYEHKGGLITISPSEINTGVTCRYVRTPVDPKWTYTVVGGIELYNGSAADFQDFELHQSEFSSIVIRMLSYFGVNIREEQVINYAELWRQRKAVEEQQ